MIFSGGFIVLYSVLLYLWNRKIKASFNQQTSKRVRLLHYCLLITIISISLLNLISDITLAGQWTTRIIIVVFLISGLIASLITPRAGERFIQKIYFRFFLVLPLILAAFSMLQFIGTVVVLSLYFRLTKPYEKIFFENENLRVQSTFTGMLAPLRLDIIERNYLFERKLNKVHQIADIDSVRVQTDGSRTLVLLYESNNIDTLQVKDLK